MNACCIYVKKKLIYFVDFEIGIGSPRKGKKRKKKVCIMFSLKMICK